MNYNTEKYKKNNTLRNFISCVSICAVSAFISVGATSEAYATEGGATAFPVDVDTIGNGFLPAPGTGALDIYTQWYKATSYAGPSGHNSVPGFDLSTFVVSPRLLYTLPIKINLLSSFDSYPTIGIIQPIMNLGLNYYGKGSIFGLGDSSIETDLSFDRPQSNYFSFVGFITNLPTGAYNTGSGSRSLGLNYYTFNPQYLFSWFPTPRLEIDEYVGFDINTTNNTTHYHSGADFDNDYGLNYTAFPEALPNVKLGVQGYFYKQIQDDTVNGHQVSNDGNRGQSFGIGPQISIKMFGGKGGIDLKYTHQFEVRNQPKGDKFWFEIAIPLS